MLFRRYEDLIPVAGWSKASVCGLSLAGSAGLNPDGRMVVPFL
jgi:hypothetical protein